ncbi:RNA polymerase sporulation-specific sigma factor [Alkalibacterium subtropicum]|uniref:RNA polymerase sporulation-specific sigma factor n=1 Tax=Alkalibacterium subtropicum TaxID=753702 RepID=A0A1I1LF00_9LACT|nr:sigma-70 family RNA polymerase sigma factor [Alkalibacterium subtropicum]SFC71684.1 RNA polymerase sporulation-specific sigma factor [Alkalibacterium subtropicum]
MQLYTEKEVRSKEKVYKDISDPIVDSLIIEIQSGDASLFPDLLERSEVLLRKATYRRFIKGYERDDLYQEACLILVEAVEKYEPDRGMSFNQYVCLCLDNHFNRLIRKSNAIKRKSFKESLSLESILEENGYQLAGPAKTLQPEDKPIVNETMEEYIKYLSSFEKDVCLYCFLGHSYEKIAEDLGCTREKVMNAKHRCTEKYRKHFM